MPPDVRSGGVQGKEKKGTNGRPFMDLTWPFKPKKKKPKTENMRSSNEKEKGLTPTQSQSSSKTRGGVTFVKANLKGEEKISQSSEKMR